MPSKSTRTTAVVPVRLPLTLIEAIHKLKGGTPMSVWCEGVLAEAARQGRKDPIDSFPKVLQEGYTRGRKEAWADANRIIREALQEASAKLNHDDA